MCQSMAARSSSCRWGERLVQADDVLDMQSMRGSSPMIASRAVEIARLPGSWQAVWADYDILRRRWIQEAARAARMRNAGELTSETFLGEQTDGAAGEGPVVDAAADAVEERYAAELALETQVSDINVT